MRYLLNLDANSDKRATTDWSFLSINDAPCRLVVHTPNDVVGFEITSEKLREFAQWAEYWAGRLAKVRGEQP